MRKLLAKDIKRSMGVITRRLDFYRTYLASTRQQKVYLIVVGGILWPSIIEKLVARCSKLNIRSIIEIIRLFQSAKLAYFLVLRKFFYRKYPKIPKCFMSFYTKIPKCFTFQKTKKHLSHRRTYHKTCLQKKL